MAARQLIELDDAATHSTNIFSPGHFSSPNAAIVLKVLKPSVWGDDDAQAQLHTVRLRLGLHVPKRYLIIAQQADNDGSEVFLRFPISLAEVSYTVSTTDNAARLVLEVQNPIRHEIVYSETTGSLDEREIDRCMVHLNCTMSVRDFEKGTKLMVQAKDKLHEQEFRRIILGINGLIQGEHQSPQLKDSGGHSDARISPANAFTAAATPAANIISTLLDPFESPKMASVDLLGEVIPDIWQGLEQLDISVNKKPSAVQQLSDAAQARAESNEFGKEAHAHLARIRQPFGAVEGNPSELISLPITLTEDVLDSNTPSSDGLYLPPTRDVSTIQTLPSAVVPRRAIPTVSTIEPYIPCGGIQGTIEEQQLQQTWQTTNAQWSSTRKKPKYADAKATYISGPRRSDDVRRHELRVDSSGELKGGLSSTATDERTKENRGTNDPEQRILKGSGKGAFRNLSGRRAGRYDKTVRRGTTEGSGNDAGRIACGGGFGRYGNRVRAGRGGRGGRSSTDYHARNTSNGW